MAKNWWEDDSKEAPKEVSPTTQWWSKDPIVSEVVKKRKKSNIKPLINPPGFVKSILGNPEDSPSVDAVSRMMGKGVPILGHFIGENEDTKDMEKNYPITSKVAKGTGAVGSMMGPAGLVSKAVTKAGAELPKLLPEVAAQFGLGATTGVADKWAEKGSNVTQDELVSAGMWGGAAQGSAPFIGRGITPNKTSKRLSVEDLAEMPEHVAEKILRSGNSAQIVDALLNNPVSTGMGGALLSYGTGMAHPLIGAALGATVPAAIRGYGKNTLMHNTTSPAILAALMGYVGRETEPK